MGKYVAHFEDGFRNYNIFETDTTDKNEIDDLAWQSAYEVANSDIKYVEWYELEDFDDDVQPMVVITKAELALLLKCKQDLENMSSNN